MKLSSVVDCVGIDREIKILEEKTVKYHGNALDFYGQKFPRYFRSRGVIRIDAEDYCLVIHITKSPTFDDKNKKGE